LAEEHSVVLDKKTADPYNFISALVQHELKCTAADVPTVLEQSERYETTIALEAQAAQATAAQTRDQLVLDQLVGLDGSLILKLRDVTKLAKNSGFLDAPCQSDTTLQLSAGVNKLTLMTMDACLSRFDVHLEKDTTALCSWTTLQWIASILQRQMVPPANVHIAIAEICNTLMKTTLETLAKAATVTEEGALGQALACVLRRLRTASVLRWTATMIYRNPYTYGLHRQSRMPLPDETYWVKYWTPIMAPIRQVVLLSMLTEAHRAAKPQRLAAFELLTKNKHEKIPEYLMTYVRQVIENASEEEDEEAAVAITLADDEKAEELCVYCEGALDFVSVGCGRCPRRHTMPRDQISLRCFEAEHLQTFQCVCCQSRIKRYDRFDTPQCYMCGTRTTNLF
jgi:hypothetical protein